MSASFYFDTEPTSFALWMGAAHGFISERTYDSVEAATQTAEEHIQACPDCSALGFDDVEVVPTYDEVNLSNANASTLLNTLGLFGDDEQFADCCAGSVDAQDFLGRVLTGLALAPVDAGRPVTVDVGAGGTTMVDCGRPDGYVQARLLELHDLATRAIAAGAPVRWS